MPCCFKLRDFCLRKVSFEIKTESLSPNYFRQVDDDVYFLADSLFSESNNDNNIQSGRISLDEGYEEEESEHISEEEINEKETK